MTNAIERRDDECAVVHNNDVISHLHCLTERPLRPVHWTRTDAKRSNESIIHRFHYP